MANVSVGILMGSDSDLEVMKEAAIALEELGIGYEMDVISAHRTPDRAADYARTAVGRGVGIIIAGAGAAAHLAGVLAAHTTAVVIGVPVMSGALGGVDALYATVQMPPGIPVATVGINGARNAGLLAGEIIAQQDQAVREKLTALRKKMSETVAEKGRVLREGGFRAYIDAKKLPPR